MVFKQQQQQRKKTETRSMSLTHTHTEHCSENCEIKINVITLRFAVCFLSQSHTSLIMMVAKTTSILDIRLDTYDNVWQFVHMQNMLLNVSRSHSANCRINEFKCAHCKLICLCFRFLHASHSKKSETFFPCLYSVRDMNGEHENAFCTQYLYILVWGKETQVFPCHSRHTPCPS